MSHHIQTPAMPLVDEGGPTQHQFSEETGVILFSECLCSHLEGLGEQAVLLKTSQ